jgi:hypothetical protein
MWRIASRRGCIGHGGASIVDREGQFVGFYRCYIVSRFSTCIVVFIMLIRFKCYNNICGYATEKLLQCYMCVHIILDKLGKNITYIATFSKM